MLWIHRRALGKLKVRLRKVDSEWDTPLLDSIESWRPSSDPLFPDNLPSAQVDQLTETMRKWFQFQGCPLPPAGTRFTITPSNASTWLSAIVGLLRTVKASVNHNLNNIKEQTLTNVVKNLMDLHELLKQQVTEDLFTKTTLKKHFLPKRCMLLK